MIILIILFIIFSLIALFFYWIGINPDRNEAGEITECIGCHGNCDNCRFKKLIDKERK